MCGRFTETAGSEKISKRFKVTIPEIHFTKPRYNITPSQPVLALVNQNNRLRADWFVWGLVPVWAKDPAIGNHMINARAETVAEKPAYRGPFKNSRCLVVADGFYEWRREGTKKQPMYIRLQNHEPFGFAGLWSHWSSPDGSEIRSCTILTTSPNDLIKPIHDRMPVILPETHIEEWLDPSNHGTQALLEMLKSYPADEMEAYPVSSFVNSPSNDSPECISRTPVSGAGRSTQAR